MLDVELQSHHIQALSGADAVAAFFARLAERGRRSASDSGVPEADERKEFMKVRSMGHAKHYTDLLKAHNVFTEIEGRWRFYDAYMQKRDSAAWLRSGEVPLEEGLLLFGFIHSWDPNFQGDLPKFLQIYQRVFPSLKRIVYQTLVEIHLNEKARESISKVFDEITHCPRIKRREYTDTSKILHAIIPDLFVMWDEKIRQGVLRHEQKDGRCYAQEFLPRMQEVAWECLDTWVAEKGGDRKAACAQISQMAGGYTLPKLIDEYNYVRYTKGKTLAELHNTALSINHAEWQGSVP